MTNVTCGLQLTAKKPGSAPCPTLVIEYGTASLTIQTTVNIARSQWKTSTQKRLEIRSGERSVGSCGLQVKLKENVGASI